VCSSDLKEADRWEVARTYFVIGVEHILFGFDHLFFVLALVLLLQRGWIVAQAVTAFTVSHSNTLVGTTLGFLGLPQRPVESVIALSIMFLAVEIVKSGDGKPRLSQRIPWVVAFLFGLLHGFGFAGALKEIGLPQGEVPMALLTFNLGVEAGQLAIVIAALAVLAVIRRARPTALRPVTLGVTYLIGITASYWFIERTLV
jgi:hydrogenase/urease accessory protein HupE